MTAPPPQDDAILISARLSPAEAPEHLARIRAQLNRDRPPTLELIETEDCRFPTSVALQLCLAAAAELRAAGATPTYGPEAQRLLGAQNLL